MDKQTSTPGEMCLQWNLGDAVSFYVEETEYSFKLDHPLMRDETYHETIEVVTTDGGPGENPYKLLCVKRVKYLTTLNLPIWERRIPHHSVNSPPSKDRPLPKSKATQFECPLMRSS